MKNVLCVLLLFFTLSLQGYLVLPLTFKASMDLKQLEPQEFGFKINSFFDKSFEQLKDRIDKHCLIKNDAYLQKIRHDLIQFRAKNNNSKLLDILEQTQVTLGVIDAQVQHDCRQLRAAIMIRAMKKLLMRVYKNCIETLILLEKHAEYWGQQYRHQNYYFFHRSPLKWFSKSSRRSEIVRKKKSIEDAVAMHQKMMGHIALLASEFNAQETVENQYQWINRCCSQLEVLLPTVSKMEPITEENCLSVINKMYDFFGTYEKYFFRKINRALMPSHVERNWAFYTIATAALAASSCYIYQNPHALNNAYKKIADFCIKNYMNHVRDPLLDIKNAFFIKKNDAVSAGQQLKKVINDDLRPSQENLEQLKKDYCSVVTDINQTFKLKLNAKEIEQKAFTLNENYLDDLIQVMGRYWEKGGVFFESYWTPLTETTKSKVANKCPSLGILYARVLKANTKSLLSEVSEIAITRMDKIDFDFQEIQQKKLNLVLAVVAFLPAAGFVWGAYKGIRSFGSYLLPKGYDDTPIKSYTIKMQDLLDDAQYMSDQKNFKDLDSQLIGKLFYYADRLEHEIKHISQNSRAILQKLLEKYYASATLEGKKLYLEKILHEYYSWPRFIQR